MHAHSTPALTLCGRAWRQVLREWGRLGGSLGPLPLLAFLLLLHAPAGCRGAAASTPARSAAPPASVRAREMADADAFQFPFTPYAVQTELMTSVYSALNEGQVGIFESPTGVSL
jgi:hypothetical protein